MIEWLKQAEDFLLRRLGTVLGVVALGVSGLFGGLQAVEHPVPTTAVNQAVDGGPWRITVTGARLINDLPDMRLKDPGNRWVAVLVTVEITEKEGWGTPGDFFEMEQIPGLIDKVPTIVLVRDGTRVDQLNPGMPEALAFLWEQRPDVAIPTELTIKLLGMTKRPSSITDNVGWFEDMDNDLKPVYRGTVRVPVVDKRVTPSVSPSPSVTP